VSEATGTTTSKPLISVKRIIGIAVTVVSIPIAVTLAIDFSKTFIKNEITHEVDQRLPLAASRLTEWRGEELPNAMQIFLIERADTARIDSLVALYRGEIEDGSNIDHKRGGVRRKQ
jgi:hypothetical protein